MYEKIEFHVRGVAPLLMHNGRLADPLNSYAQELKKVSSKRKKTDADYLEMSRIEFYGGMYTGENGEPVIPSENIEAMLIASAKKQRLGETFKAGVLCDREFPLIYTGPKDTEGLWESGKFIDRRRVVVGTSAVIRTRPIFRAWELKFSAHFNPELLNESQVVEAVERAGTEIGMMDYTPKFGRFVIV